MISYDKYWDTEYKLVKPNPFIGLPCQGNIMEISGKLLMHIKFSMEHVWYESEIIKRYKDLWFNLHFLPRSLSKTLTSDLLPEKESWINIGIEGYMHTGSSTTQAMYLLFGMWMAGEKEFVRNVMNSYIDRDWSVRWDGKTVENGSFYPCGIMALQRYVMGLITSRPSGLLTKLMLWTPRLWSRLPKNYGFWGKPLDEGEWFGIAVWLYWIAELGRPKYLKKYLPKYYGVLKKWLDDKLINTDEAHIISDITNVEMLARMEELVWK